MTEPRRRAFNSTLPARSVSLAARSGLSRGEPLSRKPWSRSPRLLLVDGAGAPVVPLEAQRQRRETGPSAKVRKLVLERDGYSCVCCGISVIGRPYSLQHRKRRSQGGDSSPSNLITVLGTGTTGCHERIDSRRDPEDEARGYTVRSWDDPALIPVMLFSEHGSGATLWLTDDGGYSTEPPEGRSAW